MCNKVLQTVEDVTINFKEHELQNISVDNEYFYSDHIVIRKPDILDKYEYKQIFQYAMPHEYQFYERPAESDDSYDDSEFFKTFNNI